MSYYFIPRNKEFWLYHGTMLLFLSMIQAFIITFFYESKLFNALASLLWLPAFTMAVLFFRKLYKEKNWHEYGPVKIIPIVVIYGLISGFAVTFVMLGIVTPFFWDEIAFHEAVINKKITPTEIIVQMIIGNGFQTQLFISGWIFIYMSVTTKRRVKETELFNLRLQNSLKEAELANLTNQLNPHFLFNALNNIRFTIYENPQKADNMLTALSEILRYSLESSKHEKVQLSEELEIIHRYIAIIKIQMESRLDFAIKIPEQMHAYLIPPMILQILIENSIKHGIDKLRSGGLIELQGSEQNNNLEFIVTNTIATTASPTVTTGIGLKNIRQRLNLLYGDRASINLSSNQQQFSVTITIPKELCL